MAELLETIARRGPRNKCGARAVARDSAPCDKVEGHPGPHSWDLRGPNHHNARYSDLDLLAALLRFEIEFGRRPSDTDLSTSKRPPGYPHASTIDQRLGWAHAWRRLGWGVPRGECENCWTVGPLKQGLCKACRDALEQKGALPRTHALRRVDAMSQIIRLMRDWAEEFGFPPTSADWSATYAPKLKTRPDRRRPGNFVDAQRVQKVFGDWPTALRAAGLDTRPKRTVGTWPRVGTRARGG